MIKQDDSRHAEPAAQVKTQVALPSPPSLAREKQKETREVPIGCAKPTPVDKNRRPARASLQRLESYLEMSRSFAQQVSDQKLRWRT